MNHKSRYFDIQPLVFYPALFFIGLFVAVALIGGEQLEQAVKIIHHQICDNFGWAIILSVNVILVGCLILAFGPFGKIRLGGKDAVPEFSFIAWFSMLLTAGLGGGILFFSVAEPISHFTNPPIGTAGSAEAAQNAMLWTFLHFGLHGWSIFAIVGVAVAYFTFNKGLPLTMKSAFTPLLGNKTNGLIGNMIDIATIFANLFGVALTLSTAAQLIANGLYKLFGIADSLGLQLVIVFLLTAAAATSLALGLSKGIKVLSRFNIQLAIVLLLVILLIGPTVFILDSFIQNTGTYFQSIIELGTWTETYQSTKWQNDWTTFYWIWWIAWAPFIGIFIARISKGRTIKEFVLTVMMAPTLLVFFWFSVFGNAALHLEMQTSGILSNSVQENPASGFFEMISYYPLSSITSIGFLLLASTFFITSSDSASLVNDFISSGGKMETPKGQRIFWAVTEGLIAMVLLSFGGLGVINGIVTLVGFLFMWVILGMCWSFFKELNS